MNMLDRIAIRLTTDNVFFAQLYYSLPNHLTTTILTAATNGKERFFNPDFLKSLKPNEKSLLIHELLHDFSWHSIRMEWRDPKLWNIVCDIKVNRLMQECKVPLPPGALLDRTCDGKSEEQVYNERLEEWNKQKTFNGESFSDDEIPTDVQPFKGTPEEKCKAKDAMAEVVARAIAEDKVKGMGKVPASLVRQFDAMLYPKETWYQRLFKYFKTNNYSDYDFSLINRRELQRSGIISAPLSANVMDNLLIAVDCSGSIGPQELSKFVFRINEIGLECKPKNTRVVCFDTELHSDNCYESTEYPIEVKPVGGGGTSFTWLSDIMPIPDVCIVLTDCDGTYPGYAPEYPVIWVCTDANRSQVPFGELITMED